MKKVMIFDLDGTVVNSEWRTPRKRNGSIDIEKWVGLSTPNNIAKDTLLPLAKVMKKAVASKDFVIVATARIFTDADRKFLSDNSISPTLLYFLYK